MPVTINLEPSAPTHSCPMCDPIVRGLHKMAEAFVVRFQTEQSAGGDFEATSPEAAEGLNQKLWELEQWIEHTDTMLALHYAAVGAAKPTFGKMKDKLLPKKKLKYTNTEAYLMLAGVAELVMSKQKHAWSYMEEYDQLKAQGMSGLSLVHAPELAHYQMMSKGFAQGIVKTGQDVLELIDHIVKEEKMVTPTGKAKP